MSSDYNFITMKGKKRTDLERAEELGKDILRQAMDQRRDILRQVEDDTQKELESFKRSLEIG